jgi:uncharacterized membrane protein YkoI
MLTKKKIDQTYNLRTVTSIFLLSMILTGISLVENRHIVIAQANNTLNDPDKLDIEEESIPGQSDLKPAAKITNDEAIQLALKNVSGLQSDVKGVELENENGNIASSVNVVQGNESKDVKVGAVDGNILEVENGDVEGEDNNDDANEGDNVGDDDTGEYENKANKYNSTEMIQQFL